MAAAPSQDIDDFKLDLSVVDDPPVVPEHTGKQHTLRTSRVGKGPILQTDASLVASDGMGYQLEEGDAELLIDNAKSKSSKSNLPLGLDPALVEWAGMDLSQVVELLPYQFTTERKACLKKEKLPAIKAAVVQTMNDSMLLARPFHVYKKHAAALSRKRKPPWPPHVLTIEGQERNIVRRRLAVAARLSNREHAHFLWIKKCDEKGCDKVYRKKQGANKADTTDIAGFLQYNELKLEDGKKVVVVNTVQARHVGDKASEDDIKRLLLFWFYLKQHAKAVKDQAVQGQVQVQAFGFASAGLVDTEEDGGAIVGDVLAQQTRDTAAWDKATDTKTKEKKAREAARKATQAKNTATRANKKAGSSNTQQDQQEAKTRQREAEQATKDKAAAQREVQLSTLRDEQQELQAKKDDIETTFTNKEKALNNALTTFKDKLARELELGTCEGERCQQKVKSKCVTPCTWTAAPNAPSIQPFVYDMDKDNQVTGRVQQLKQDKLNPVEQELARVRAQLAQLNGSHEAAQAVTQAATEPSGASVASAAAEPGATPCAKFFPSQEKLQQALARIRDGRWLNDDAMLAYLHLVADKAQTKDVVVLKLERKKESEDKESKDILLNDISNNVVNKIKKARKGLILINKNGDHWILMIVSPRDSPPTLEVYDSMMERLEDGDINKSAYAGYVDPILQKLAWPITKITKYTPTPSQSNNVDCGVYVLKYAETAVGVQVGTHTAGEAEVRGEIADTLERECTPFRDRMKQVYDAWDQDDIHSFEFGSAAMRDGDKLALVNRALEDVKVQVQILSKKEESDQEEALDGHFSTLCTKGGEAKWDNSKKFYTIDTLTKFKDTYMTYSNGRQASHVTFLARSTEDSTKVVGLLILKQLSNKAVIHAVPNNQEGKKAQNRAKKQKNLVGISMEVLCADTSRHPHLGKYLASVGKLYADYVKNSILTRLESIANQKQVDDKKLLGYYNTFLPVLDFKLDLNKSQFYDFTVAR